MRHIFNKLFKKKQIVDPVTREGSLAFANGRPVSCNPYISTNADHAQLWESGWHEAQVRRQNLEIQPPISSEGGWDWDYGTGFVITAIITFIGSWIYCIATYGFLFGVGLGWLPSIIVAVIAGALWPLIALAIIAVVLFFAAVSK